MLGRRQAFASGRRYRLRRPGRIDRWATPAQVPDTSWTTCVPSLAYCSESSTQRPLLFRSALAIKEPSPLVLGFCRKIMEAASAPQRVVGICSSISIRMRVSYWSTSPNSGRESISSIESPSLRRSRYLKSRGPFENPASLNFIARGSRRVQVVIGAREENLEPSNSLAGVRARNPYAS